MMISVVKGAAALTFAVFLSGCLTTAGPEPVLSRAGPVQLGDEKGLAKRFQDHELNARNAIGGGNEALTALAMKRSGIALVRASCEDYFREAGHTQRGINVGRQLIATGSALASTVLLGEDGNENLVQYLGIATSGSYAVLDTYTENFLFSAANIASVRTLIMSALDVHRDALSETPMSYEIASQQIFDHQAVCLPQNVADLVRQAISAGRVVPVTNTSRTTLARNSDQQHLRELTEALGGVGALTNDQAGALWWLINGEVTNETLNGPIKSALGGFDQGPFREGVYQSSWPARARVTSLLDNLSEPVKATYAARAAELAAIARTQGLTAVGGATFQPPVVVETTSVGVAVLNQATREQ